MNAQTTSVQNLPFVTSSRSPLSGRIPELDGLRAFAVLGVLVWHFTGSMMPRDGSWLSSVLMSATVFGRTGVDLFFILSGYLIIGILIDQKDSPNVFRVFYIRRFFRIWPPYLVLVGLYWLVYVMVGESEGFNTRYGLLTQLAAQVTFTWNILMAITDSGISRGFSVVWSVCIEEWFYIVIPALIVALPRQRLLPALIAIAAASAFTRALFSLAFPDVWLAPYVLLPFRMDGLCIGGVVAVLHRSDAFTMWMVARRGSFLKAAAGLLLVSIVAVYASGEGRLP